MLWQYIIIIGMAQSSGGATQGKLYNTEQLLARIAGDLQATRAIAYACIGSDLRIIQASENFISIVNQTVEPDTKPQQVAADLPGKAVADLIWEFASMEEILQQIVDGAAAQYHLPQVNRSQPDGSVKYYNFRVIPTNPQRSSEGLLLIIEDITREGLLDQQVVQDRNELRLAQAALERANQELQALNQLKSLFLSMAAHDLRTPLAAIRGYADLGLEQLNSGEAVSDHTVSELQDTLRIIHTQGERLDRLISDILDLDLIERGKLTVYPMACELVEMIQETTGMLAVAIDRQGLTVRMDTPDAPLWILADPPRLRQILYNLLGNAIKYTRRGGSIQIRAWRQADGGYFRITDNGRGISEADREHLFQLFFRTPDAERSQIQGTGLGLFIVKYLVEAQNGRVSVESKLEEGTSFIVQLPLANINHVIANELRA